MIRSQETCLYREGLSLGEKIKAAVFGPWMIEQRCSVIGRPLGCPFLSAAEERKRA